MNSLHQATRLLQSHFGADPSGELPAKRPKRKESTPDEFDALNHKIENIDEEIAELENSLHSHYVDYEEQNIKTPQPPKTSDSGAWKTYEEELRNTYKQLKEYRDELEKIGEEWRREE